MEYLVAVRPFGAPSTRVAIDVGVRPSECYLGCEEAYAPEAASGPREGGLSTPVCAWSCTRTIVITSVNQHRAAPSVRGIF